MNEIDPAEVSGREVVSPAEFAAALQAFADAHGTTREEIKRRGRLLQAIEYRCWQLTHPIHARVRSLRKLRSGR